MSIWERIRQAWKGIRAVFHTVNMLLGERIRKLREAKSLSQRELEQRSGLLRCYIERVEHGHTVPSLETLERLAGRLLDVPLYRLFYDEGDPDAQQLEYFSRLEHALQGQRGG